MLAGYRDANLGRSVWQLLTSLVPFLALWMLMWWALEFSWPLVLLLAIPASGFLVRLFVLQHDCGHGSFFKSARANNLLGCTLSIFTLMPYYRWRKTHAVHHATSGDLDRRGCGDVHMLTVAEYRARSPMRRLIYRVHRHPLVLFGVGPFLYFVVFQRFAYFLPREWKRERANVYWTNLLLLASGTCMSWLVGLPQFVAIHVPIVMIAGSIGVWLFYVQHHFEPTYWRRHAEWDFREAGIYGSSYYKLPVGLQWITANIGLHHIHHLDSQIPNYRLQQCFDENPALQQVHELRFWESLSCASLRLWDEQQGVMVPLPLAVNVRELSALRGPPRHSNEDPQIVSNLQLPHLQAKVKHDR
jgi:omega-6 fatty acid desaturase (delta-12 desaturase)